MRPQPQWNIAPDSQYLQRLFPDGSIVMLTERILIEDDGIRIMDWVASTRSKYRVAQLMLPPNVRPWLLRKITTTKDEETREKCESPPLLNSLILLDALKHT